jgi:hypothetical protein
VEATLGALLGRRGHHAPATSGGPGLAELRADGAARRRAIDAAQEAESG